MFRCVGRTLLCAATTAAATTPPDVAQIAKETEAKLDDLSPRKIAAILDKYIVGQADGKRAVAISLRNRWRRRQLAEEDLRHEVVPKNMLLIGPTGVGKTEISRRMARITNAPFIKVEATKYTEVGFKGKDVESIIEELYTNAKGKARKLLGDERRQEAEEMAIEVVASAWIARHRGETKVVEDPDAGAAEAADGDGENKKEERSTSKKSGGGKKKGGKKKAGEEPEEAAAAGKGEEAAKAKTINIGTVEYFKANYKTELQDHLVTIEIRAPQAQKPTAPSGIDMQSVGALLGFLRDSDAMRPTITVVKKVSEAIPIAAQDALEKLIDENAVNQLARTLAEEEGVVFIDEIDKVVAEPNSANADVSSTGVQQDLLPLVEGSNVTMKDGSVIATDNILFICSGAFHVAKTSDMIAELQGRLPVRVELKPLTETDFRRILTEPKYNLLLQHKELMKTENVTVDFTEDGVKALARVTCAVNAQGQNIGARRLHTILERVMDEYSFNCEDYEGKTVSIDEAKVKAATEKLEKNVNLAKYLL